MVPKIGHFLLLSRILNSTYCMVIGFHPIIEISVLVVGGILNLCSHTLTMHSPSIHEIEPWPCILGNVLLPIYGLLDNVYFLHNFYLSILSLILKKSWTVLDILATVTKSVNNRVGNFYTEFQLMASGYDYNFHRMQNKIYYFDTVKQLLNIVYKFSNP